MATPQQTQRLNKTRACSRFAANGNRNGKSPTGSLRYGPRSVCTAAKEAWAKPPLPVIWPRPWRPRANVSVSWMWTSIAPT